MAARLAGTLRDWDCWDEAWEVPTSGGITQARQRLGHEPLQELFSQVAVPVAEELTRGAFLGRWRLMAIDGFEWDAPATEPNIAAFGFAGAGADDLETAAFPKARVVTISECASHAVVDARIGGVAGKGTGEQSLARPMLRRLEEDWLLIADRNFYNWQDWCAAADTGAALLWRVKAGLGLPVLELLPDGSYRSVLVSPKVKGKDSAGSARGGPPRRGPGPGQGPLRAGDRVRGPRSRRRRDGRASACDSSWSTFPANFTTDWSWVREETTTGAGSSSIVTA